MSPLDRPREPTSATTPRRVAFFESYPHVLGGAQRLIVWLATRLPDHGWEPFVVLPEEGPLTVRLRQANVSVMIVRPPSALDHYGGRLRGPRGVLALAALPQYARSLAQAFADASVVHASDPRGGLLAGPAARLARRPMVAHLHIVSPWTVANFVVSRLAAEVVGVSPSAVAATRGLPRDVAVEPNPIEPGLLANAQQASPGDTPMVVSAARYHPDKGLDVLLEAFALVHRQRPDARLRIIGGPQRGLERYAASLEQQIERLGLSAVVELTGWVGQVSAWWTDAWLYVQPSRTESYCFTVVEAMASGLPIVGSDVPGICEHLAGRGGQLVPSDDPPALASAIEALLSDRDAAAAAGRAALDRVSGYPDLDTYTASWARRYDRLAR